MKQKDSFNYTRRSRWLFLSLLALLLTLGGTTSAWADAYNEGFEAGTNGWAQLNSYSAVTLGTGWGSKGSDMSYYRLNSSYARSGSTGLSHTDSEGNSKNYVITPKLKAGSISLYAKRTASSGSSTQKVYLYLCTKNELTGEYTIGTQLSATSGGYSAIVNGSEDLTKSFKKFDYTLSDDSYVAILIAKAGIDDFSAPNGLASSEVPAKAVNITSFVTTTPALAANSSTQYTAFFTVTVANQGSEDIVAGDNVTVSLLNSEESVLATSDPIAIAQGASQDVVLNYTGTALTDQDFTFKAKDNFSDKIFATTATVSVTAYGARFSIDTTSGTSQSLGATAIGGTLEKTFTITNSGNADLVISVAKSGDAYAQKTLLFSNDKGWSDVYLYAWNDGGALTPAFPGNKQDATGGTNEYGQPLYSLIVPKDATKIIVSNGNSGNGNQSQDIPMDFNKTGLYLDGSYAGVFYGDGDIIVKAKKDDINGSAKFTVGLNSTAAGAKSGNVVLTFNAINEGSPFTIPVTGAVLPAGTETVDFNDNQLPTGWSNDANNKWSFDDGKASCTAQSNSPAELVTKKLDFTNNDFIIISATSYDNYDNNYIEVLGSTDNGTTWTAFDVKKYISRSQIPYSSYATLVVSDIPNTVNKLKFRGYYVRIDEIAGLKYSANDPKISVTQFAEPDPIPVTSGTLKDFGWSNNDAFVIYNISNSGTGTLTISNISVPDGFTAVTEGNAMTVAAGNSLQMTVTMTSGVVGPLGGTITLTTDGGNFEIPVKGFIYGNKNLVDFTDASQYQGWTTEGWTISEGVARPTSSYSAATMQTTKFNVDANEKLYVDIKGSTASAEKSFAYSYSTDNGTSWTAGTQTISAGTYTNVEDQILTLEDIAGDAERTVLLSFTSKNLGINRIYGFTAVATPVMETTAADIAFGSQTAESTEQTFTISNTGTADLTGLSVTLGKTGEDAEYVVRMEKGDEAFTGTTIAPSEVVTVYVKQLYDINKLGSKSDVLTIAAINQASVAINLTGTTKDPSILYVDFDDPNAFPEGWQIGSNWNVYTYGADRYAYQNSSNTPSSLVTTPLKMEEGKTLSFKVARYSSGYGYTTTLKTRYSQNGGATWSDYTAQYGQDSEIAAGSGYNTIELNELPTGDLIFEFFGNNIKLDMIQGIKKTTAPAMALSEAGVAVANGDTKAFENLKADGTATYTLKNIGNAEMVSTVAVTGGATVAISGEGEGVTIADKTVTLAAGKSATIMLTVPFESPYNDMAGAMTITTTGWVGDFTVNYTASLVDPTDFNEDFADGKPAGWYSENWVYSGGAAHIYQGVDKPMITEKIGAVEGKNILRFDAKVYYGDDDQTLNVYTSTDRKNWSDAQVFNITSESSTYYLTALAEGQYYVKFEAANVAIDNVKGVKKLAAPAHDLFEISNTITGTGVPGAEYTATVTAVSLIADESDIVAELWLKKAEAYYKVASLENQTLTANESKALTLTGNLPDLAAGDGYKMYITVKKSDDAAYFNTDEVDFTLAHNLELTINSFAVTTPAVQADDNNEYTATFNINVTNTGSRDLSAEEVSVSLINKISDPDVVFTSKWTKANSQTIFLNPGGYTSGANMAIYRWNDDDTDEQKEWALFTEISTGFYSAELNGKKNFIICRVNPATAEGDLAWDANVYNQSDNLTTAHGNIFGNNGYNGQKLVLTEGEMATLAKNVSTTLQVTVSGTLTDGEDKNLTFYAREDEKNTILDDGYTYVTRTAAITAAPVIELDETAETYDVAANVNNRKVQVARSFNAGWNTICLPFAVSANDLKTQYGENVALYELTSFESNNLQFTQVNTGAEPTGITAGKPYLIYVEDAITTPKTFVAATVFAAAPTDDIKGSATFKGTYTKMAAGLLENKYGVSSDNRIAKGNASTTMKGFRAYLEGALSSARIAIIDETTGITRIFGADEIFGKDDKVYDLNGRRVENAKKGIYIVNGRKMVVK